MVDEVSLIYEQLSPARREIRVLTVLPELKDGLVACTLEKVSLEDEHCHYNALSWCWGDAKQRKLVEVNGYFLEVPANADKVLREVVIRHGYTDKIWLDAICINQSDIEERASQVSIMRQVYSGATKVLAWLGDDQGFAARALSSVDTLVQHCRGSTNDLVDYDSSTWLRCGTKIPRRGFSWGPLPDGVDWEAIQHLYSTPLLERLWVVQEISLAKVPLCFYGNRSILWRDIGVAAEWMVHRSYERSEYCGSFVRGIMTGAIICSARRGLRDLDKLLMTSVHYDCSEPRDKVFGLLGLAKLIDGKPVITPDYKMAVRDVFIAATRIAIFANQRLHILGSAQIARAMEDDGRGHTALPSWVPQYAMEWKRGPKGIRNFAKRGADNDLPFCWDQDGSIEVLRVKGLPVASIAAAFGPLSPEILHDKVRTASVVRDMLALISSLNPRNHALSVLYHAFTARRAKGFALQGEQHEDLPEFQAFLEDCMQPAEIERAPTKCNIPRAGRSSPGFLDRLRVDALHRSFFVTTDGQAGQSSSLPVAGDTVCIVFGSDIPLILRSTGPRYSFVGGAYLEDLMDGSHVAQKQQEGALEAALQWFDII